MFDAAKIYPEYKNLIGWNQFFDTSRIDVPNDLLITDSGEYYQEKSGALRLDYIQATLSANQDLFDYLREKVKNGITGIFNDILTNRQVEGFGKTLLEQAQLLNRYSWSADKIVNENKFVGFQIKVRDMIGLQTTIDQIGLQLDGPQVVTLYLFHSSKEDPLTTIEVTTTNSDVKWTASPAMVLSAFKGTDYSGGVFILGYYQSDLVTSAVNYSNFNWQVGECGGCNSNYGKLWESVRQHFYVYPLWIGPGNFTKGKMFNIQKANYSNDLSYGLNLKLTVRCDLSDFFINNKFVFKNLLALKVCLSIMQDMKYSMETNFIEQDLKDMVIRDLEGDKETNALNISQQYNRELKAVTFNMSGINNRCLGCQADTYQPIIGHV